MEFTGERYCPEIKGEIALEHCQRYELARELAQGKDVLDVASGEGYGSAMLANVAKSVTGVELSPQAVAASRQRYDRPNLRFVEGNAAKLPFGDDSFDLVVSFETIEHLAEQEEMLGEIRRVLKSDGLLLLSSPDREVNEDFAGHNPYHVRELYKSELEALIGRHFDKYALFGQRMVFASVLAGDASRQVWNELGEASTDSSLPEPKYHIVIASNGELPQLPFSVLEGNLEDSEKFVYERGVRDRIQKEHADLSHIHKDLEQEHRALEQTHGDLIEDHQKLIQQYSELREHHAEAARNLQIAKTDLDAQRQHGARLRTELDQMLNSRSWRLTAPLRYGMHKMRKVRKWFFFISERLKSRANAQAPAILQKSPGPITLISGEPKAPGHVYRMERLAAALAPDNEVILLNAGDLREDSIPENTSLIWIWRASLDPQRLAFLERAKARGAKIIFDIDDMCFHPDHYTVENMDALRTVNFGAVEAKQYAYGLLKVLALADCSVATTYPLMKELFRWGAKPSFILRNTFDHKTRVASAKARYAWLRDKADECIRIGYAAGTPTHQADLGAIARPLANVLKNNPNARLVLFNTIDVRELPDLEAIKEQIEWRDVVPLEKLPQELARFDINIAPLEPANRFCECKSELKFFEAALLGVPTVAQATIPFGACIQNGENGFVAQTQEEWQTILTTLLDDASLRKKIGEAAKRSVLWPFGPEYLHNQARAIISYLFAPASDKSVSFNNLANQETCWSKPVNVPDYGVVYSSGDPDAKVSVVIPLYNYEKYVLDALDSLLHQTLRDFDVIVVNDCSTDNSEAAALAWLKEHADRFHSVALLRNSGNSGLGRTRNVGIDYSGSEMVMLLDADNRLLPGCMEECSRRLDASDAAFVYPKIQKFGDDTTIFSDREWDPMILRHGNYIDAMSMIRRACWAAVGGYSDQRSGWEDYDLWCKFTEAGFWGINTKDILAQYRVHNQSMLRTVTDIEDTKAAIKAEMSGRHNWLYFKELK